MTITGKVQSGTGRGAKFIAIPIYEQIFENLLGKKPFYGTLNLEVSKEEAELLNSKFKEGKRFENLVYQGKEYGGIITIPVTINCSDGDIPAVGVRPLLTTHDSDIVELVCHKHLRDCLDLEDGDIVSFELEI